jgi:4-amino-4-deoxy-L-arabinose transferase-like glycosyltransferase
MPSRTRVFAVLVAIAAVGAGLRGAALEATWPVKLIGDENYYGITAINIASGRGHINSRDERGSRAWRPPAHAYALSWFVDADLPRTEENLRMQLHRMMRWQVALATLLILATGGLGWALFDARVGMLAAGMLAVYPNWIAHSHTLWSEPLFALLVTTALAIVVLLARPKAAQRGHPSLGLGAAERSRKDWAGTAAAGLLFGLAALTREAAVPVAAVCGIWLWQRAPAAGRPRALAQAALMLALVAAVIAPWTLRNQRVLDRVVPVSTVGWFAAGEGNTLETPNWLAPEGPAQRDYHVAYFSIADEGERLDYARHHALGRIAAEQPAWIFKKILRSLAQLGDPDSVLLFKIRRGTYGDVAPGRAAALAWLCSFSYGAVLFLGVLGLSGAPGPGRRWLAIAVFAVVAGLHVLANATPRFRLPWMPLLMVYAAWAALHLRELPRALAGRRWIAAAAVMVFFASVCVPYFITFGGRQ